MDSIEACARYFEMAGYGKLESLHIAKLAVHVWRINPGIGWDELVDAIKTLSYRYNSETGMFEETLFLE